MIYFDILGSANPAAVHKSLELTIPQKIFVCKIVMVLSFKSTTWLLYCRLPIFTISSGNL